MWSRKAECVLNAHVKEKLCLNSTVVTVEESLFIALKNTTWVNKCTTNIKYFCLCVFILHSVWKAQAEFKYWGLGTYSNLPWPPHFQSSPKDLLMESFNTNWFHSWNPSGFCCHHSTSGWEPMCPGWCTCWKRFLCNAWTHSPCFTHYHWPS